MSLWTMLRLCRYFRAPARLYTMMVASLSVYLAEEVMASNKSPPCAGEVRHQTLQTNDSCAFILPSLKPLLYLDELHNQVEFGGSVHLLYQHDDVGVFHLPQHCYLILYEVLLDTHQDKRSL